MILNCPKCRARFLVADHLVPHGGRVVRCGACSHEWLVKNEVPIADMLKGLHSDIEELPVHHDEHDDDTELSFAPTRNVPALSTRKFSAKPFKLAVPALVAVWFILGFFAYFPSWSQAPVLSSIYSLFGVTSTEGLTFSDVKMDRETNEGRTRFIFSGNIVNHAKVSRNVPLVHIALNDKKGKAVWGRDYPVNVELKAGEVYPFRIVNVETSFADSVTNIVLDLGNSFQLMVR